MPLFRKRSNIPSTGHPGDDQLIQILATQHGPLDKPRHWVHYVYVADQGAAEQARHQIEAAGWSIQRIGEAAKGPGWVVIAERRAATLTPETVKETRAMFERVAATVPGGDYDGWEASG